MAVEVIHDEQKRIACFYDNTTDYAFGPVFTGPSAGDDADDFLDWLKLTDHRFSFPRVPLGMDGTDPRDYSEPDLRSLIALFEREREAVDA